MNIIEAIKSGRPFRRPSWHPGCNSAVKLSESTHGGIYLVLTDAGTTRLTAHDMIADDWETEPAEVTITREKLQDAWNRCCRRDAFDAYDLARELGLE